MRYALSVEVKLQKLEEPEVVPAMRVGDDPLAALGNIATTVLNAPMNRPALFMGATPGFDFRKSFTVSAENFQDLAAIIGQFDKLAFEIEAGSAVGR